MSIKCNVLLICNDAEYDIKDLGKEFSTRACFCIGGVIEIAFGSEEDLVEFVTAVSELEIANDVFNAEKEDK